MVAVGLFIVNLWWIRRQDADQEVKELRLVTSKELRLVTSKELRLVTSKELRLVTSKELRLVPRIAAQRHLVISEG